MTLHHPRTALALIALAALAACGGGTGTDAQSQSTPQRMRALSAGHGVAGLASGTGSSSGVAAATTPTITAQQLFTWAQLTYPDLFGTTAPATISGLQYQGKVFDVRAYATGNYLGVTNTGEAYGYGPFVGNQLYLFGPMQQYASLVCSKVDCTGGGTGGGNGTLNECFDPNTASPPTGARSKLLYTSSGVISGDMTIEALVDGPQTFEGQTATQITATVTTTSTTTISGATMTSTSTTKSRNYQQATGNGLYKILGSIVDISSSSSTSLGGQTIPGVTSSQSIKFVENPAYIPTEETLTLGQSVTRTQSSTSTILANSNGIPPVGTVSTSTDTETYTFEAKESVTVAAGTYSACRYKTVSGTGSEATTVLTWYILGKGVMAKSTSTSAGTTQVIELKPGSTYNGAPL